MLPMTKIEASFDKESKIKNYYEEFEIFRTSLETLGPQEELRNTLAFNG
jgi:hypothetical protein